MQQFSVFSEVEVIKEWVHKWWSRTPPNFLHSVKEIIGGHCLVKPNSKSPKGCKILNKNSASILQRQWRPGHNLSLHVPIKFMDTRYGYSLLDSVVLTAIILFPSSWHHKATVRTSLNFQRALSWEEFRFSKIKTPLYSLPLYPPYIVQGNKGNHPFFWQKPMAGKRSDLSVEDAICLGKAWGWGLIGLATESGCQLASSGNCFPWQDPGGRGKGEHWVESRRGNLFHLSPVIIVQWARGDLLPICARARALIDTHWPERPGNEGGLEGLDNPNNCHSKRRGVKSRIRWKRGEKKRKKMLCGN